LTAVGYPKTWRHTPAEAPAAVADVPFLDGKVALVTGAAGGVGSALCTELEARGARVVPVDLEGDDCLHYDLSSEEQTKAMVAEAFALTGRQLDVLLLNAGLQYLSPISTFPTEKWDHLFDVMVRSPFITIREAWPALVDAPAGRIVVIGSRSSLIGTPHKAAYISAKHAVLGLVRAAAAEGVDVGITANLIAPGWIDTPLMWKNMAERARLRGISAEKAVAEVTAGMPGGKLLDPAFVAHVAVSLTAESAWATNGMVFEL
jgi:3-hydroxybutyrate dehydrogenase